MKKNFDNRLATLREYLKSLSADETVFIVEGGGEYCTKEDPRGRGVDPLAQL